MKYVSTQRDPSIVPAMTLATNSLKMESIVQVMILNIPMLHVCTNLKCQL